MTRYFFRRSPRPPLTAFSVHEVKFDEETKELVVSERISVVQAHGINEATIVATEALGLLAGDNRTFELVPIEEKH